MNARLTLLGLILLSGACTDDKQGSASDASSGGATDSGESSGDPSTGAPGETGDAGETDAQPPTTGGEATSDGPDETTGEAPPELLPECQALCDKSAACGLGGDDEGCVVGCSEQYAAETQVCADATSAYLSCMAALSCEEILGSLEEPGPCPAEADQRDAVCGTGNDFCGVGWGGFDEACDLEIDCRGEPLRRMLCDLETCTCLVDDEQTGSCAAEAICDDLDALKEKGATCCGF